MIAKTRALLSVSCWDPLHVCMLLGRTAAKIQCIVMIGFSQLLPPQKRKARHTSRETVSNHCIFYHFIYAELKQLINRSDRSLN